MGGLRARWSASPKNRCRASPSANDRRCRKTQAELKKRIAMTYAKYEARQIEFDRVEHAEGGTCRRLVTLLGKGK